MFYKKIIKNVLDGQYKELLYNLRAPAAFPSWAKQRYAGAERLKTIRKDKAVVWRIDDEPSEVYDHIEMSGFFSDAIVSYGKDKNGNLRIYKFVTFPTVRLRPNLTTSQYRHVFKSSPKIFLDDTELKNERLTRVTIKGTLTLESDFMGGAAVTRTLYPSPNQSAFIEKVEITNNTKEKLTLTVREKKHPYSKVAKSIIGPKVLVGVKLVDSNGDFRSNKTVKIEKPLAAGATSTHFNVYCALRENETVNFNTIVESKERDKLINFSFKDVTINSGSPSVDALFAHALLRSEESIFSTEKGLLHSPGGGKYYAAIWANDELEYAAPMYPYFDYEAGIKQAVNCFALFGEYVKRGECVPSSLVGGGVTPFGIAGDRGDTEMYAYGLARFLLAKGDRALAEEYYQTFIKALDFCLNKKSENGLIFSDSDELEGRFPSGDYNLNTNCLLYDALNNGKILAAELAKDFSKYEAESEALKIAIIKNFRATVEGCDTYKYFDGCEKLRAWSIVPATMGIDEAAISAVDAVFGDLLYDGNAMRCESGTDVFWDRALLYALRAAFIANHPKAFEYAENYAKQRLIGAHSPYPYEAYPEGNKAHLSAESALYCRAVIEGMMGIKPIAFTKLLIEPKIKAKLNGITFAGEIFEIDSTDALKIRIGSKQYYAEGKNIFDFKTFCWM